MDQDSTAPLHQMAIEKALSSSWEEALELNNQIIAINPQSVDALNRAARCYFELGNLSKSKKLYEQALNYDPYNQIAAKFLKRIAAFKKGSVNIKPNGNHLQVVVTDLFIKEPGKTKLVNLLKVAEPQRLSLLSSGAQVQLVAKNHCVNVTSLNKQYLGILPDDIAHRLVKFIRGGNKYQAFIKSIKPNSITILIKEVFRSARFKNQPSFPELNLFPYAYSSDHIVISESSEEETEDILPEEETI